MKIILLGPASSIHLRRWAEALSLKGIEIIVVTQHEFSDWKVPERLRIIKLPYSGGKGYFLNAPEFGKILKKVNPDILNVHYASGYGTIAALTPFRKKLLSVWGSDVFEFPYQSIFKKKIFQWNVRTAKNIASTSEIMAKEVIKLVPGIASPYITPFGVDCEFFSPNENINASEGILVIGTVKSLNYHYGMDILIRAFGLVLKNYKNKKCISNINLILKIVGDGPDLMMLKQLAVDLGIADKVEFFGKVSHDRVPACLSTLDIYVAPSRNESFGVAIIEASACGLPVIVSDAGGLPEVVIDTFTGFVVPKENINALAEKISILLEDYSMRIRFGVNGREFVQEKYEWNRCVDKMIEVYHEILN